MANSINGSSEQIQSNYEKYKEYFTDGNKNELGQMDFLSLMVEQMKNQDFSNPTDNSEYIAQLAQFNSLQQMQQMTYYTNASFAASLVGKTVTMASVNKNGEMEQVTDVVSAVKMNGQTFEIIVDGKTFTTSNLMEIVTEKSETEKPETDKPEEDKEDKEDTTEKA